jgi:DNA-binding transcriptional LysR family regulator
MDLHHIEQVLAVFEHGGVSAAARALHLAQPSVSETLRRVEREIGTPLFHRVGRRLVPTAAGEAFVGPARQLLRDREVLLAELADVAGGLHGRLDLACLPTLAGWPLAPLVAGLRRAHPYVTVRVVEASDLADSQRRVLDGSAELALTELPAVEGLESVRITRQELYAVLPPRTPTPAASITVAELAVHPLLTGPPGSSARRQLDAALRRSASRATIVAEVAAREALVPLVLAGAGATVLPADQAASAQRQGAAVRPIEPPVRRWVGLVHRRGALTPLARAMIELIPSVPQAPAVRA